MKIEIIETQDGSHTLYLQDIDEHYHSTFGAIQESQHVFIRAGLNFCKMRDIRVLEIGFGTGLNCYLTLLENLSTHKNVHYYSIEKYPLSSGVWGKLNFSSYFSNNDSGLFSMIHLAPWNCDIEIDTKFVLHKVEADLLKCDFKDFPPIDLVFFDAFSPDKQPELWNRSIFEMIYLKMSDNGILVTYCAKGYVRRLLQSVGFQVERIPGPPGKRQMMRAIKNEEL